MAKGKKRKAPSGARGGERGAPEPPPNLFERLSNRKRFDILGRKVKGETKQLGKLRSAATEKVRLLGGWAHRRWASRCHTWKVLQSAMRAVPLVCYSCLRVLLQSLHAKPCRGSFCVPTLCVPTCPPCSASPPC